MAVSSDAALIASWRAAVGEDAVLTDERTRILFSQDVYRSGALPLAVIRPKTIAALQRTIASATQAGVSIFARGGGLSYTDAFLPSTSHSIIIDTQSLNRVVEINAVDLHVTVEAGMTWMALDAALAPYGVRSTFWGPMSGKLATIGGACSQGAVTFGSGRNGVSGQTVLGFEVVLADGRILRTGSAGQGGRSAFFRHSGPDLTGFFAADSGAFGVKATVTLALEPRPGAGDGLSFAFDDFPQLLTAVSELARHGLATEIFGAESALVESIAGPPDLRADLRTLLEVMRAERQLAAGVIRALRIAIAGRRFLRRARYLVNVMTEASDRPELRRTLQRIRRMVGSAGTEITNTVPQVTRATPFPDPMLLGPGGLRLLPLHGIFPPSAVLKFHTALVDLRTRWQSRLDACGVRLPVVYATVGRNAFLYEPVIYWPDTWPELHREIMAPAVLDKIRPAEPSPLTRALVEELRVAIIELMSEHGAVHLQIGRAYPYLLQRDAAAVELLRQLKATLDPGHLINPGALGL